MIVKHFHLLIFVCAAACSGSGSKESSGTPGAAAGSDAAASTEADYFKEGPGTFERPQKPCPAVWEDMQKIYTPTRLLTYRETQEGMRRKGGPLEITEKTKSTLPDEIATEHSGPDLFSRDRAIASDTLKVKKKDFLKSCEAHKKNGLTYTYPRVEGYDIWFGRAKKTAMPPDLLVTNKPAEEKVGTCKTLAGEFPCVYRKFVTVAGSNELTLKEWRMTGLDPVLLRRTSVSTPTKSKKRIEYPGPTDELIAYKP